MLERNPSNRKSAEIYLSLARGKIFPEYFYSFLQSYMLIFSAAPILSPDEKINRLKKDIGSIINILRSEESKNKTTKPSQGSNEDDNKTDEGCGEKLDEKSEADEQKENECGECLEGLIIITQLVTSCIRGLHYSQSKLQSLEIFLELAEHTSDETILDRILPYIVSCKSFHCLLISSGIKKKN